MMKQALKISSCLVCHLLFVFYSTSPSLKLYPWSLMFASMLVEEQEFNFNKQTQPARVSRVPYPHSSGAFLCIFTTI